MRTATVCGNVWRLAQEALDLAVNSNEWSGIERRIKLDSPIAAIYIDRIQIHEVLLKLIRNAVEAMAGCNVRSLVIQTRRQPADICEITVKDTGTGISPCTMAATFELNTATPNIKGIALSINRTIIEAQGGHIWSRSDGFGSSMFGFTVPIAA